MQCYKVPVRLYIICSSADPGINDLKPGLPPPPPGGTSPYRLPLFLLSPRQAPAVRLVDPSRILSGHDPVSQQNLSVTKDHHSDAGPDPFIIPALFVHTIFLRFQKVLFPPGQVDKFPFL